ncbi:ubiquinone biosynthesis regulatory protein kinase UbiB [Tamilnaduibacter salinus]|uniref:Probable protein kinase UbiB n=1 Tax=Tamilnaduibacter salinus TaxID=1484056 RepID=A0A2A2I2P5_9GAMM|nr:ubiquinone biosynthesis regulatory protein kinase UbiB [Tamilnaduibacter salinus]PAV25360.1 ubiquinone biosynthesis regulatory protein kinase UbiB [Tamilnaduibacter salinus]
MSHLHRSLRILWVICRYRLDTFFPVQSLPLPARLLVRLGPWRFFPRSGKDRAERLRLALEALGPIFIKFGQLLSTRRDLLPDDLADSLSRLQDRVPPFPGEQARDIIEASFGQPIDELFQDFETSPVASASVAQVHAATLPRGQSVVVKVVRPGIDAVIRQDIRLMRLMARLMLRYWEEAPRLRPLEVVEDYEQVIFDELDMQREAANASQLRRNFEHSNLLYVPAVDWDHNATQVLVMERIHGIPIGDTEALKAAGVNMKVLAEKGVEIFFTQVFRDRFFHADMHPGNIFVDASNPEDPRYIALDFGIVGTLAPVDQNYLARNLLAFFRRDYRQVAELHVQSGWVPADTRVDQFESAIRTACEPIFARPLSEISFGYFLLRLFQTARRFNMEVQPQLVLLQKTLLNVEGLGRQLYPDLDLWATAQPFLERWMKEQVGPASLVREVRERLPEWIQQSPEMPQLIHDTLRQIGQGQASAPKDPKPVAGPLSRRRRWLATGCLVAAALLFWPTAREAMQSVPVASWALLAAAGGLVLTGGRQD